MQEEKYFYPQGEVPIMDDTNKAVFKIKFVKLVILLNLDIFLFFLGALFYFFAPLQVRTLAAAFSLIAAVLLGVHIYRQYRQTKAWLDEHA